MVLECSLCKVSMSENTNYDVGSNKDTIMFLWPQKAFDLRDDDRICKACYREVIRNAGKRRREEIHESPVTEMYVPEKKRQRRSKPKSSNVPKKKSSLKKLQSHLDLQQQRQQQNILESSTAGDGDRVCATCFSTVRVWYLYESHKAGLDVLFPESSKRIISSDARICAACYNKAKRVLNNQNTVKTEVKEEGVDILLNCLKIEPIEVLDCSSDEDDDVIFVEEICTQPATIRTDPLAIEQPTEDRTSLLIDEFLNLSSDDHQDTNTTADTQNSSLFFGHSSIDVVDDYHHIGVIDITEPEVDLTFNHNTAGINIKNEPLAEQFTDTAQNFYKEDIHDLPTLLPMQEATLFEQPASSTEPQNVMYDVINVLEPQPMEYPTFELNGGDSEDIKIFLEFWFSDNRKRVHPFFMVRKLLTLREVKKEVDEYVAQQFGSGCSVKAIKCVDIDNQGFEVHEDLVSDTGYVFEHKQRLIISLTGLPASNNKSI